MKKITLFIMDVGVLDQRFSLSGYWQGKSLVSRVVPEYSVPTLIKSSRLPCYSPELGILSEYQSILWYYSGKRRVFPRKDLTVCAARKVKSIGAYLVCQFANFKFATILISLYITHLLRVSSIKMIYADITYYYIFICM